jgi:hypothetical protein
MTAGWRIAAASVVGTSHERTGSNCQDSHDCRIVHAPSGVEVFVGVVADGAGSAERSEEGSRICCLALASAVERYVCAGDSLASVTRDHALQWLGEVRAAINAAADGESRPIWDFACTLLAAVVGDGHAIFLQVGDGAIVVPAQGEPNEWCWVFWPQNGEFANTTNFVTDEDAPAKLEFDSTSPAVAEVAIFSDGVENLVLRRKLRDVHAPFFNAMLPPVRALPQPGRDASLSAKLAAYLGSPVIVDKTDDDKTLVIAVNCTGVS